MAVGRRVSVRKYDRAPIILTPIEDGVAQDISAVNEVTLQVVSGNTDVQYTVGSDAEVQFVTDGSDGQVAFTPPSGGWQSRSQLALWVNEGDDVWVRYPQDREVEVEVVPVGTYNPFGA